MKYRTKEALSKGNNIELFRLTIDGGFNQGDLSVADEVCAEEFSKHQYLAPTDLSGPENLKVIQSARKQVDGLT